MFKPFKKKDEKKVISSESVRYCDKIKCSFWLPVLEERLEGGHVRFTPQDEDSNAFLLYGNIIPCVYCCHFDGIDFYQKDKERQSE